LVPRFLQLHLPTILTCLCLVGCSNISPSSLDNSNSEEPDTNSNTSEEPDTNSNTEDNSNPQVDPDTVQEVDQAALDEFFSLTTVHTIEIEVDQKGWQELTEEPRNYTHAQVRIGDHEYQDVGVRLKGMAGSFIPLNGEEQPMWGHGNSKPGKSAFIIDFNRYQKGVNHLGLKKLTINNMVQDASCIHEHLGYALFREGEVPAPRSGYAQVSFNGEEKGLYALIESPDNAEFLQLWFGSQESNIYEGSYGVDLYDDLFYEFDQDHGDDDSMQDLRELVWELDELGLTDPLQVLEEHLNLEEYLNFAVTELYLGHWDGYAWSTNNYMIHHDLENDRWTFLPWGIDQIFEDELGPYSGVMKNLGPSWEDWGGRIQVLCFSSPACRERLYLAFEALLDRVDQMNLLELAAQTRELVEPLVLAEASAYGDPEWTEDALNQVWRFVENRREQIEAWLPCLVGDLIDHDSDSFDGCQEDCDDWNPDIYPGAGEECNFMDDDCNGILDDPAECPKCIEEYGPDQELYSFCFERFTWQEARQACLDRQQELVSLHDIETAEVLSWMFAEITGHEHAWIGLNDLDQEGDFSWSDESEVDFDWWQPYSPSPYGTSRDCVLQIFYGWRDAQCDEPHGYICKIPD